MKRAKLIKKNTSIENEVKQPIKPSRLKPTATKPRTTAEVTQEWLKEKQADQPGAREAFALLFDDSETQSA